MKATEGISFVKSDRTGGETGMLELTTQEQFDELVAIRRQLVDTLGGKGVAGPFLPMVGERYGQDGLPKLMYVGKATAGWSAPDSGLKDCIDAGRRFYREDLVPKNYGSAFWRFIYRMTAKMMRAAGFEADEDADWVLDRVIWDNLIKISADETRPPGKKVADPQRDLMERMLRHEIAVAAPDAILFLTNDYEWSLIEGTVGNAGQRNLPGVPGRWTYVIDAPGGQTRVYWTRHPQGWPNSGPEEDAIAADFAAFLAERDRAR